MSERATCATEGCGAEIQWGKTSGKWFHNAIGLWGHHAHPAGGTNTTPPEELERDVTELHEILEYVGDYCDADVGQVSDLLRMIRSYGNQIATQAAEEATAEEGKWRDEYNALKNVTADLRDQLDRHKKAVEEACRRLIELGATTVDYTSKGGHKCHCNLCEILGILSSSLAPLETECEHHPVRDLSAPGTYGSYEMYPFCPKCGELLTKGTP